MRRISGRTDPGDISDATRALRNYRRMAMALGGLSLPAEGLVLVDRPMLGLFLGACSLGLMTAVHRLERAAMVAGSVAERRESPASRDAETGLPTREQLTEQLARDIARRGRFGGEVTLAVIDVVRPEELRAAWGGEAVAAAVGHVAATLRRVTRTSDFVARIEETRFGVVLVECNRAQAARFADRVGLAVGNRPLRAAGRVRVPIYVNVDVRAVQYDPQRFRGPLEMLSVAGGDIGEVRPVRRAASAGARRSVDGRDLRRELIGEHYRDARHGFAAAPWGSRLRPRRAI